MARQYNLNFDDEGEIRTGRILGKLPNFIGISIKGKYRFISRGNTTTQRKANDKSKKKNLFCIYNAYLS